MNFQSLGTSFRRFQLCALSKSTLAQIPTWLVGTDIIGLKILVLDVVSNFNARATKHVELYATWLLAPWFYGLPCEGYSYFL